MTLVYSDEDQYLISFKVGDRNLIVKDGDWVATPERLRQALLVFFDRFNTKPAEKLAQPKAPSVLTEAESEAWYALVEEQHVVRTAALVAAVVAALMPDSGCEILGASERNYAQDLEIKFRVGGEVFVTRSPLRREYRAGLPNQETWLAAYRKSNAEA